MNERAGGDPLVSIGLPVRNGERFIREALDSLLAQTYERFELIISDNASADATREICLDYASRDPRISYHRNAVDLAMPANFRRVFELSSGPYFFWAGHDDVWDPTFIARCLEVLARTPSAVLCYPAASFIGPQGEHIEYRFPSFDTGGTSAYGMSLASRLHVHMWGITFPFPIKGLLRSQALAQTRLAQDKFGFDLPLLIELSMLGEFAYIPTPLFRNRLTREGDPLDRLSAVSRDIGMPVTTRRSALYRCGQMVFANAQAVNRHASGFGDKALLIPSAVLCTLVKYNWLMRQLLDLAGRKAPPSPAPASGPGVTTPEVGAGETADGPGRSGVRAIGRKLAMGAGRGRPIGLRNLRATLRRGAGEVESRLEGLGERLEEMQGQLDRRLETVEDELAAVVAGMELGSVPARQTTYLGHPFVYPSDSAIGQSIAGGRDWDPVLRTIIPELLRKDEPVIWEVGSNIGASLYQIMCAKPRARVLAFEPSRRFRPFLERNVELAGFDHVEVLPLFVGRQGGQQRWLYGSGTTAGVVEDPSRVLGAPPGYEPRGREFVRTTTLDEVRRDRSPIDFLKVDTDGVELDVLRGGAEVLEQDRPVLFFELTPGLAELIPTPLGDDLTWLHGLGYRRLVCFSPTGAMVGATDDPEQALAWAHDNVYCDVLTCFRGSAPRARLAGLELSLPGER